MSSALLVLLPPGVLILSVAGSLAKGVRALYIYFCCSVFMLFVQSIRSPQDFVSSSSSVRSLEKFVASMVVGSLTYRFRAFLLVFFFVRWFLLFVRWIQEFVPSLAELATDSVVNVRIAMSRTLSKCPGERKLSLLQEKNSVRLCRALTQCVYVNQTTLFEVRNDCGVALVTQQHRALSKCPG